MRTGILLDYRLTQKRDLKNDIMENVSTIYNTIMLYFMLLQHLVNCILLYKYKIRSHSKQGVLVSFVCFFLLW